MTASHTHPAGPVVVLGGTGKTGRRVLARLHNLGLATRSGSRTGSPPFDWHTPSTWEPLLAGASGVYLAYAPDLAEPGAAQTVAALTTQAAGLGVPRVVLLSGRGEPHAQAAEQAVRAAAGTAAVTVLRASWFAQNFTESFLADDVESGELALPVGPVGEPFVDADDIAEVAVAALTQAGHEGQLYELTGPRLLSFADVAAEIAAATGRPLGFRAVPLEDYLGQLRQHGVDEDVLGLLRMLFVDTLDGRNAWIGDGVQRALGRPARNLRDWASAAPAAGEWPAPEPVSAVR